MRSQALEVLRTPQRQMSGSQGVSAEDMGGLVRSEHPKTALSQKTHLLMLLVVSL